GAGGDQLVAAPELLLALGGPLAVARMQRLVPHDNPQAGDLLLPGAQAGQAGQVGDERVVREVAVLAGPGGPGACGQPLNGVHLLAGARPADGELPAPALLAATRGDVLKELVGEPGPVQADQEPAPERPRQPGDR